MKFEDYVREELQKIDQKLDHSSKRIEDLMIFMAVQKASDSKNSKITAGIVSIFCSVISSGIMYYITKG